MLARMWKTWNTYTLLIGLQSGAATLKNCFSEVTIWPSNSIVVQSLSCVQLFATPWTAAPQSSLLFTISPSLLRLMSTESVMPSNHLILCRPFLLLPSIFPSFRGFLISRLFASGGQSIGASTSASVLPMNIQDWFPSWLIGLISLQTPLKGLLQHHGSKASILQHSAFFMVQFSYP